MAMAMAMAAASSVRPPDTSWPVIMAQFVPPPSEEAVAKLEKKALSRKLPSLAGTWLTSMNMATVTLSSSPSSTSLSSPPSIALILQGNVHEEHLLSSLAFTWPSFPTANGESPSPGRVVFASYIRTETNTMRKFAMQFEAVSEVERFFQIIKQLLTESIYLQDYENNVPHINSILISSNACHKDASKDLCLDQSNTTATEHNKAEDSLHQTITRTNLTPGTREIVSLPDILPNVPSQSQIWSDRITSLKSGINLSLVDLPPRFPPLEWGQRALGENPNTSRRNSDVRGSNILTDDLRNDQVLKEKMMACFLDPDFQGFVDHVERVWRDLEDDLAAEISSVNP